MTRLDPIAREWVTTDKYGVETRTPLTDAEWAAMQADPAEVEAHNAAQKVAADAVVTPAALDARVTTVEADVDTLIVAVLS